MFQDLLTIPVKKELYFVKYFKKIKHFLGRRIRNLQLSKGRLTTDLHIKDTYRHQYLHFNSSHPDYTKRSIVYSQALRLNKICTFENDFLRHRNEMK